MNNFIYNIPTKVYFGENQLSNLGKDAMPRDPHSEK